MNRALRLVLAALLTATGTAATVTAPAPTWARAAASLSVAPGNGEFTAGQELRFTGSIGRAGRDVRLQTNMGRPGDIWRDVPGARARSNASGDFTILTPAAAMEGILYRAVSGSRRTPVWTSQVQHQDVVLRATSARAGAPVTITADTRTMPYLPGRGVTLQQRSGTRWTSLATTTLGADGQASFSVGAPTTTAVYRVRLEEWRQGVGRVGWFPSYPLHLHPGATGDRATAATARATAPTEDQVLSTSAARAAAPYQTTAGRSYRWGTTRYDFDWEHGESLTDRATGGTRRRGWWLDESDGTGRVALRNGAMQLSSQPEGPAHESRGSTWATLQRHPRTYGRWEARVMPMTFQQRSAGYTVRVDLVPADPAQQHCGAQDITIAELSPARSEVVLRAKALSGTQWSRTLSGVTVAHAFHAFAVEVTPQKITWFMDGRPVGKVADAAAVPDVPMTVRVSMVGSNETAMTTTRTLVDWVRNWPTGTGARTRGGTALTRGTHTPAC